MFISNLRDVDVQSKMFLTLRSFNSRKLTLLKIIQEITIAAEG